MEAVKFIFFIKGTISEIFYLFNLTFSVECTKRNKEKIAAKSVKHKENRTQIGADEYRFLPLRPRRTAKRKTLILPQKAQNTQKTQKNGTQIDTEKHR